MIRSVDITAASDGQKPAPPASAPSGKRFAEVLKTSAQASSSPTDLSAAGAPHYKFPDGETWKPVLGHRDYAKIITGPRAGMYMNLTLNERHGEAFSIEQRGGKTVHVYDIGGQETVVPAGNGPKHARHHHAAHSADTPPAGETWAPIAGNSNYADILNGPRNGLYVNTQGGMREGMAFEIRKVHGRTFHVYGSGPKRLMVEIIPYVHKHQDSASSDTGGVAAGTSTSATSATTAATGVSPAAGGVSAPSA